VTVVDLRRGGVVHRAHRLPARRRLALLLLSAAATPLCGATMEQGLALKRAQDLPAAARVFDELVIADPGNVDAIEQLATVTGWMGRHAEALILWQRAIALAPQYAGLRVGRARVLYWMGRLPEAASAIDEVLPLLPSDADAMELAGDIARARHQVVLARDHYLRAMALDPASGAGGKMAALTPPRRWRADAGGMFDSYDPANTTVVQRGDEQSAYVQLGRQLGERFTLAGGADYAHQFSQVDWRFNLEGYWAPRSDLSIQARAALTPDAEVLADWEASLGADWRATSQVAGLLTVRTSDFASEHIVTWMPGLRFGEETTLELRLFYTVSDVQADTSAVLVKIATTIDGRWQPYALASYGEENQPPIGVAKTASGAIGTVIALDAGWALRIDGIYEWREAIHRRISLGGGATYRF
jgi:YaiO family outer membrane protein